MAIVKHTSGRSTKLIKENGLEEKPLHLFYLLNNEGFVIRNTSSWYVLGREYDKDTRDRATRS